MEHQHGQSVVAGQPAGDEILHDADRPGADLLVGFTAAAADVLAAVPGRRLRGEALRGLPRGQARPLPQ